MSFGTASLLASSPVARWVIENSPIKLQIARVWPFMGVDGGSISYARQLAPLTDKAAAIVNNGDPAPDGTDSVNELTAFTFNEFMTSYQINAADQDRFRHPNDIDAAEYALALRRLLYAYFKHLDAASGLQTLTPALNKVSAGGALTLDFLDEAYQKVTANDGRPTVVMISTRGLLVYQKLCRDKGFEPPKIPWQWYDPALAQMKSGEVTAFNGTPMLINDLMEGMEGETPDPELQRIYFMVLGDDGKAGPTRGVTGIVPDALKQTMFVKRTTMGASVAAEAAVAPSVLTTWVTWPTGFAVGSQGAISLVHNFAVPA